MGEFIYFTEEQKERANAVPIADILRREREEVIRSGNEWRWKRHQSVTFRGSSWYRHSQQVGSHAIDFMQEFFGMTYPEAVTYLLDGETGEVMQGGSNCQTDRINQKVGKKKHMEKKEEKELKELKPPEKNPTMKRVYAYLLQKRHIGWEILSYFAKTGTLYESTEHHNIVFAGLDKEGKIRHIHIKGTCSDGRSFRQNEEGSDSSYGFGYRGGGNRLYVFEAPIDLLSFLTLYPHNWQENSYITLNGVSEHAMLQVCVLIALGGGVVGDVTGFVAGTYMCGVRYVQVPTTLLAQVDSSIGGKTGIDGYTLKNIIGIFKQPEFVFINTSTLETLNDRHYRAGITEMLVHGLVGGVEAFDYLQNNMNKILLRDNDAMQEIIVRSCDIKVKLVENDEFENSVRSYLNLGHTIGHAIEGWINYQILHGEAVSIGIYAIFKFACQKGFIKINDVKIVNDLLMKIGLPICLNTIEPIQIMKRMRYDKKVKNGKIYVIIPTKLGEVCIYPLNANDEDIILQILKSLKQAF